MAAPGELYDRDTYSDYAQTRKKRKHAPHSYQFT